MARLPTEPYAPIGDVESLEDLVREMNARLSLLWRYQRAIIGETRSPDKLDKTLKDI